MKRICSSRSKFFPLRVDPSFEGFSCTVKQTGNFKSYLPLKMAEKHGGVSVRLKHLCYYLGFKIIIV